MYNNDSEMLSYNASMVNIDTRRSEMLILAILVLFICDLACGCLGMSGTIGLQRCLFVLRVFLPGEQEGHCFDNHCTFVFKT